MNRNARSDNDLEKTYQFTLRTHLISKNWWIRKLHGNLYQSGLPDLFVCRPKDGKLMLIEVKTIETRDKYYGIDLIELLEGPQTGTVLLLAKKRAPVLIVAGCTKGWLFVRSPFKSTDRIYPCDIDELYDTLNTM